MWPPLANGTLAGMVIQTGLLNTDTFRLVLLEHSFLESQYQVKKIRLDSWRPRGHTERRTGRWEAIVDVPFQDELGLNATVSDLGYTMWNRRTVQLSPVNSQDWKTGNQLCFKPISFEVLCYIASQLKHQQMSKLMKVRNSAELGQAHASSQEQTVKFSGIFWVNY